MGWLRSWAVLDCGFFEVVKRRFMARLAGGPFRRQILSGLNGSAGERLALVYVYVNSKVLLPRRDNLGGFVTDWERLGRVLSSRWDLKVRVCGGRIGWLPTAQR